MEIRIGTSGWNYPHWKDVFYPKDLPRGKWLEFYSKHFDTVELNATFYRLPSEKTFQNWYKRTPSEFIWSVKASKFITHTKRLKDVQDALIRFYNSISPLKEKCGPILFQLPPSLNFEKDLLEDFCKLLDPSYRYTLEVRHKSWIDDKVFETLKKYNIAFCISDSAGRYPYYEAVTSAFVYLRLHGSRKLYASEYSDEEIAAWAKKILKWERDAYIYFDNDFNAYAIKNAKQLKEVLKIK